MTDKPTLEDRVQTQEVNQPGRVAVLFGLLAWGLFAVVCWLTGTRKGWAVLIALVCAIGVYAAFRWHP